MARCLFEVAESVIGITKDTSSWTSFTTTHTGSLLPTTLWGKSPCEVSERFIRRPQNTSFWTGIEAECRDAVCVGFLRNCSHAASGQFQSTVLSLALESVN